MFYVAAFIGGTTGERYGIIFVGSCGILAALAILPVVIDSLKKEKTIDSVESGLSSLPVSDTIEREANSRSITGADQQSKG